MVRLAWTVAVGVFVVPASAECKNVANIQLGLFGFDAGTCGGGLTIFGFRIGGSTKGFEAGGKVGLGAGVGPVGAGIDAQAKVTLGTSHVGMDAGAAADAHALALGVGAGLGGSLTNTAGLQGFVGAEARAGHVARAQASFSASTVHGSNSDASKYVCGDKTECAKGLALTGIGLLGDAVTAVSNKFEPAYSGGAWRDSQGRFVSKDRVAFYGQQWKRDFAGKGSSNNHASESNDSEEKDSEKEL